MKQSQNYVIHTSVVVCCRVVNSDSVWCELKFVIVGKKDLRQKKMQTQHSKVSISYIEIQIEHSQNPHYSLNN